MVVAGSGGTVLPRKEGDAQYGFSGRKIYSVVRKPHIPLHTLCAAEAMRVGISLLRQSTIAAGKHLGVEPYQPVVMRHDPTPREWLKDRFCCTEKGKGEKLPRAYYALTAANSYLPVPRVAATLLSHVHPASVVCNERLGVLSRICAAVCGGSRTVVVGSGTVRWDPSTNETHGCSPVYANTGCMSGLVPVPGW